MSRFETYPNILLKGLRVLRTDGFFLTAKYVSHFIYRETAVRFFDWRFDRRWDVDTAGIVYPSRERSDPLHFTAEKYEPSSPKVFSRIMNSVGCLTAPFVFLDMGCGKGRVLLMASKYGFKRIVGVEYLPELAKIAQNNILRFQSRHASGTEIEVVCTDAAKYQFPDENSVIFFFHPFKEEIMVQVLENIRLSAKRTKARYLIYYNPVLAKLLSNPQQFSLLVKTKKYHIYRMVLH